MRGLGHLCFFFFFFKQKTAYEIGTGDWSSDVCSSDLAPMFSCIGTEGSKLVPYLEMDGSNVFFYLRTEGSKGSLFRNRWFQCFSVEELKVQKGSLFRNWWFQWVSV